MVTKSQQGSQFQQGTLTDQQSDYQTDRWMDMVMYRELGQSKVGKVIQGQLRFTLSEGGSLILSESTDTILSIPWLLIALSP